MEVHSILFYYNCRQTREYLCLSTFFSICGFFVSGLKYGTDEQVVFDLLIKLKSDEGSVDKSFVVGKVITLNIQKEQELITKLLDLMSDNGFINQSSQAILLKLAEIYRRNSLLQKEYNSQYFFYMREEVDDSYQAYYRACAQIREIQSKQEDCDGMQYLWYARGHMVRKIQELAEVSKTVKIYDIEILLKKLNRIAHEFPDFISVYALMGYLADTESMLKFSSSKFYVMCIEKIKEKTGIDDSLKLPIYASPIFYRLGRYWEKNYNNKKFGI